MPKPVFKSNYQNQTSMFPYDFDSFVDKSHPVRLISQVVDQLDISSLIDTYKGGGTSSYHPRMLLKLVIFGYLNNLYSSRKIARAVKENIHFIWLSGQSFPDHRTINNFRGKRLKENIETIFTQVVLFLYEQGYVSLEEVFTDGTKIESVANRYTFVWKKTTERNKSNLEKKIQTVLNEIDKAISQDNDILTDDIEKQGVKPISSEELHEKIEQINKKLKSRKDSYTLKKKVEKLQREALPKLLEYEEHLNILGERNSYSKTDRDATFMRMKEDHMQNGQLKPAYNAQISTENNFITNFSLHQNPGDTTTFQDHLNSFDTRYNRYPVRSIADAGYGSLENYDFLEEKHIEPFVKYNYFHKEQTKKFKSDIRHIENLYYNELEDYFVCPIGQKMSLVRKETKKSSQGYPYEVHIYQAINCSNCPLRGACHKQQGNREIDVNKRLIRHKQKVREKLTSEQGLELRKRRCPEVEQTFGQLKSNKGFKRFLLRGLPKVTVELGLLSIAHNMQKMCTLILGDGQFFVFEVFFRLKNAFIVFLKQVKAKIHPAGIPPHSNQKITIEIIKFKEAA